MKLKKNIFFLLFSFFNSDMNSEKPYGQIVSPTTSVPTPTGIVPTFQPTTRNWNEEFQRLIEKTYDDPENELARTRELRRLCEEFAQLAKRIGTIIISELFLPIHQKTIPPATCMGGIAGGEKYVYLPEGLFFKTALDKLGKFL
jgi:hypothetical protein